MSQLERVGLIQTGFIITNPPSSAGPCFISWFVHVHEIPVQEQPKIIRCRKEKNSAACYVAQAQLPRAIQLVKGAVPPGKTIAQKGRKKGTMNIAIPVPEQARKNNKSKEDSTDELEEDGFGEDDGLSSISSASSKPVLATQKATKQKVCAESAVATETRQFAEVNML
jgi:hypothetical protein